MIERPDAVVIGSGAGGATAARVLTQRGMTVVVLEKGYDRRAEDFLPYDEVRFDVHQRMNPDPVSDVNVYVRPNGQTERVWRWWEANMVGGATRLWDANFPRYTSEDMAVLSLMGESPEGASLVDWPWTYDEFQPYFERAEHEWGVSGRARQSPKQEPHRQGYDYPMPPLRPHASTPFITEVFRTHGWHPYLGAKAINSLPYNGRPAYAFDGFLAGYGDPTNARASAANSMLPWALKTGRCELRVGHCVTRIDHEAGQVRGVFYRTTPDGPDQHISAPIVIQAVQAIQSARMFLLSEIPDPTAMIGHHLTYHTKGTVIARLPDKPVWDGGVDTPYQPRTGIGSIEVRDLYTIDDPSTHLTKGGKFAAFDPYTTSTPIELVKRTGKWGSELIDELRLVRSRGGVGFSFTGESIPIYENRVELDPDVTDPWGLPVARTHYAHHPYDLELSRYALDRVAVVLADAGGEITANFPQSRLNSGYGHNHGTLRAGIDPDLSVLDPDCQAHRVRGLYVLDCSFMPTSGASNPTLTLLANAYRVCERIPLP